MKIMIFDEREKFVIFSISILFFLTMTDYLLRSEKDLISSDIFCGEILGYSRTATNGRGYDTNKIFLSIRSIEGGLQKFTISHGNKLSDDLLDSIKKTNSCFYYVRSPLLQIKYPIKILINNESLFENHLINQYLNRDREYLDGLYFYIIAIIAFFILKLRSQKHV